MIGCIQNFLITGKPEERERKKVQISKLIKLRHRKVVRDNKDNLGGQSLSHPKVIDAKRNKKTEKDLIAEENHLGMIAREIDTLTISFKAEEGTVDPEVLPVVIDLSKGAKKIQIDLEEAKVETIITQEVTNIDHVIEIINEAIIPEVMPMKEVLTNTTKSIARVQAETEITTKGLLKIMVKEWLA